MNTFNVYTGLILASQLAFSNLPLIRCGCHLCHRIPYSALTCALIKLVVLPNSASEGTLLKMSIGEVHALQLRSRQGFVFAFSELQRILLYGYLIMILSFIVPYFVTGLPYPRVNLLTGVNEGTVNETCTAGAGSLLLEFGILSRLLGDSTFEDLARRTNHKLWSLRNTNTGLLGNTSSRVISILFIEMPPYYRFGVNFLGVIVEKTNYHVVLWLYSVHSLII